MSQPIPADQPPVTPAAFDRKLNAVADLGLDNTGQTDCSSALASALNKGKTLVTFEPGEYRIDRQIVCTTDGIGLRAKERGTVRLFPGKGVFNLLGGGGSYPNDLLVENLTLDRTNDWSRSIGIADGNWTDRIYIHNVNLPGNSGAGDQVLIWNVRRKTQDPKVLVDGLWKRGPNEYTEYPRGEITIYMGPPTTGNATYRNMDIRNTTESAVYCGKDAADTHFVDCYFENCMHTAIRSAGKGSSIRRCRIVLDLANQNPNNRNALHQYVRTPGNQQPQVMRGIWLFTNVHEREGPGIIEDCDIFLAKDDGYGHGDTASMDGTGGPHHKIAGILVGSDTGGTRIKNCRIHTDNRRATGIKAQSPNNYAAPYREVHVENCHVLSTAGGPGIDIQGRAGSSVTHTHVKHNSNIGIRVTGSVGNCEVSGGAANVTAGSKSNIGTTPAPHPPDTTRGLQDPAPAPNPEPKPEPEPTPEPPKQDPKPEPDMPELPNPDEYPTAAVVSSPSGVTIDYRIVATGELVADYDVESTDRISQRDDGGWQVEGITGLTAADAYRFKGDLVSFESRTRGTAEWQVGGPGAIVLERNEPDVPEPEPDPEPGTGTLTPEAFVEHLRKLLARLQQ